jgi:hypothetical protein
MSRMPLIWVHGAATDEPRAGKDAMRTVKYSKCGGKTTKVLMV